MITDLKHYVHLQKGFIDNNFCDKVLDEMKSVNFQEHTFYNPKTKKYSPRSGSQELSMSWDNTPSRNELTGKLWNAINNF